jgi:hypothetical protein
MPRGPHERHEHGTDVAAVTRNENFHFLPPVPRMSSAAQDIFLLLTGSARYLS